MSTTQSTPAAVEPPCRFCRAPLQHTFVDLGMSPLCQRHVRPAELNQMEPFYPLHVRVCDRCFLVQLEEYVSPKEIFNDYAYFSSYSDTMLAHAEAYCKAMRERLGLGEGSLVVELASNDGYLLQFFKQLGVGVLGIEPAANVAEAAVAKGIPTVTEFFGVGLAQTLAPKGKADLIVGNNVLAHVPDINDFVGGVKVLLKPSGVVTMEKPSTTIIRRTNKHAYAAKANRIVVRHHLGRIVAVIEIMSPSFQHESAKGLLSQMVRTLASDGGISYASGGSTTTPSMSPPCLNAVTQARDALFQKVAGAFSAKAEDLSLADGNIPQARTLAQAPIESAAREDLASFLHEALYRNR